MSAVRTLAEHRAIAEEGGPCAICSAPCVAGHYCYGCGEFMCFRHSEPHVPQRGIGGRIPTHVAAEHSRP